MKNAFPNAAPLPGGKLRRNLFAESTIIKLDNKLGPVQAFSEAVEKVARVLHNSKPARSAGLFIDTSFRDGKELQPFIDHLGNTFHYYAFEGDPAFNQNMSEISENNFGGPFLSLRAAGIETHGKQNFPDWLDDTCKDWQKVRHVAPFIVMKMPMNEMDYAVLNDLSEYEALEKISVLITTFNGPPKVDREDHMETAAILKKAGVPIIEIK